MQRRVSLPNTMTTQIERSTTHWGAICQLAGESRYSQVFDIERTKSHLAPSVELVNESGEPKSLTVVRKAFATRSGGVLESKVG